VEMVIVNMTGEHRVQNSLFCKIKKRPFALSIPL
jgi:hypothetical protein